MSYGTKKGSFFIRHKGEQEELFTFYLSAPEVLEATIAQVLHKKNSPSSADVALLPLPLLYPPAVPPSGKRLEPDALKTGNEAKQISEMRKKTVREKMKTIGRAKVTPDSFTMRFVAETLDLENN